MRIVDRYLFRRFWSAYFFSLLVFMSFFILIDFLGHLEGYLENEVTASTLARYYVSFVPLALGRMSPLSVLLACLSVAGGMARANELTALRAGGVNPLRAIAPLIAGALCVTVLALVTAELALPAAARRLAQIKRTDIRGVHTAERFPYGDEQGRHMIIGSLDTARELMQILHLTDPTRGKDFLVQASVGIWQGDSWELYRGVIDGYEEGEAPPRECSFAKAGKEGLYEIIPLATKEEEKAREEKLNRLIALLAERGKEGQKEFDSYVQQLVGKGEIKFRPQARILIEETPRELLQGECDAAAMSYGQLRDYINNLQRAGFEVRRLSVELRAKISFPLANLIVALVGIPFGLRLRRGGVAIGVGSAVVLGLAYHFLTYLSKEMGEGWLTPTLGAWLPNLIFAAGGIYLLHRASK